MIREKELQEIQLLRQWLSTLSADIDVRYKNRLVIDIENLFVKKQEEVKRLNEERKHMVFETKVNELLSIIDQQNKENQRLTQEIEECRKCIKFWMENSYKLSRKALKGETNESRVD